MVDVGCVHQAVRLWSGRERGEALTPAEAAVRQVEAADVLLVPAPAGGDGEQACVAAALASQLNPRARLVTPPDSDGAGPELPASLVRAAPPGAEGEWKARLEPVTVPATRYGAAHAALTLFEAKLRQLAEGDSIPDYVVIALSGQIVARCGTADYTSKETGAVHRDLRRALKASAMKFRLPTQIVRAPTLDGRDRTPPSRIAWNFFTAMYCKAGGYPWSPHGLTPGTCYVGSGFYRPLGSAAGTMQTSLVQAFDERGEGLVLRGHEFEWDPNKTGSRSPHLTAEGAHRLMALVLDQYEAVMKQTPARIVVHKTSRYWPDERDGFRAAIESRVRRYDLMALEAQSRIRLVTTSKYPPLRGTRFSCGELDYLHTTGYISALNEFHGMHVPAPLQVADHVGQDSSRDTLLKEVLALTKLNWNSAALGGLLPITIKFSGLVGEIMREIPSDREPLPQFKYYI